MAELSGRTQFRFEPKIQQIVDRVLEMPGISPSNHEAILDIIEPLLVKRDWEIEDALTKAMSTASSTFPFIVVADDGTGDYTSIKDAIDAVAASVSYYTYIYVKPSASDYTDTGATVTGIGNKRIAIFCPHGPAWNGTNAQGTVTAAKLQRWNIDGFTVAASANTYVYIEGLDVNGTATAGAVFRNSGGTSFHLMLRHCHCNFSTSKQLTSSFNAASSIVIEHCLISSGSGFVASSGTMTFSFIAVDSAFAFIGTNSADAQTYSGRSFVHNCTVQTGVGVQTFTGEVIWTNVRFGADGTNSVPAIAFNSPSVTVSGCSNYGASDTKSAFVLTTTITLQADGILVFDNNALPFHKLSIVGNTGASFILSGEYASLTMDSNTYRGVINVALRTGNITTITALSCAGSYNVINATIAGAGASAKGYDFTAASSKNIANIAGSSTLAVASTDTGTANVVVAT